jgi:hypothetical protein
MTEQSPLDAWLALKLGESNVEFELQTRAETQHAIDLMLAQAQQTIDIVSRDLDAALFDRSECLEKLSRFCTRHSAARIRILVQNPVNAVQQGNRLIELSRRFSSSIEIRRIHEDYRHNNEAFLVVDRVGVLHRPLSDRFEGSANFNDPVQAERLQHFFVDVWEHSEPHPDLRRLHL